MKKRKIILVISLFVLFVIMVMVYLFYNKNDKKIDFDVERANCLIYAYCTVKCNGKTGVEMEALTGVNVCLLTIYDMCKAVSKDMEIKNVHLVSKSGGKSGDFVWKE